MKKPIQYTRVSPVMKFVYLILFCSLGLSIADAAGPGFLKDLVIKNALSIGKNSAADSKAVLDMVSTTKGFLPPRMTEAQRDAIATPPTGLQVYNTDSNTVNVFNGTAWEEVGSGGGSSSGINILAPYNFNGEDGTASWTESGGGTLASTTTAANVGNGEASISYDASANADYLASTAATIPSGLFGANCLLEFYYKGGDANLTAQVHDGTNVVTSLVLAASTGYRKTQINFTCPQSGTLQMRILTSADAAIIYVDEVHLGSASNFGEVNVVTEWMAYTPTFTGFGTVTSIEVYSRRVGDSLQVRGRFTAGTTTAVTGQISLGFSGVNGNVTIAGSGKINSFTVVGEAAISTALAANIVMAAATGGTTIKTALQNASVGGLSEANANSILNTGNSFGFFAEVPITGWTALPAAALNNSQNWRVDANISGGNPDLGTADQASYVGITNSGLTLTNNSGTGVLTAQIPCSTTNSPTGTTCSVGDESVGVSFTPPRAGDVRACVSFGHAIGLGAGGDVQGAYQIVETPANAQTISQQGKSRVTFENRVASTTVTWNSQVCGTFTFSNNEQKTLRLMYEQDATATVSANVILADAAATIGQRDIHWEVYPIDVQVQAPTLVGSVTTSSTTSAERIERVRVVGACAANPCTMTSNSAGVSSVTWSSTGNYIINFVAGTFSSTPSCGITAQSAGGLTTVHFMNAGASATAYPFETIVSGVGATNDGFDVVCMGPK